MSDLLFWIAVIFVVIKALPLIINWPDTLLRIKAFLSAFSGDRTKHAVVSLSEIYLIRRKRFYSWKEYERCYKKFEKLENSKNCNEEEKEKYKKLFNCWLELCSTFEELSDLALQRNNDFMTGKKTLIKLQEEWEEQSSIYPVYSSKKEEEIVGKIGKLNPNYMNEMRDVWGFGY